MPQVRLVTAKSLWTSFVNSMPEAKLIGRTSRNIYHLVSTRWLQLAVLFVDGPLGRVPWLELVWLAAHLATIVCFGSLWYPVDWYHHAVVAAMVTYTMVVSKFAATTLRVSLVLQQENTHLLFMAMLAFVLPRHTLKLVPFCIYSVINVATHLDEAHPLVELAEYPLLMVACYAEAAALPLYLVHGLQQPVVVICYLMVYAMRLETLDVLRTAVHSMVEGLHKVLQGLNSPPGLLSLFEQFQHQCLGNLPTNLASPLHPPKRRCAPKQTRVASWVS